MIRFSECSPSSAISLLGNMEPRRCGTNFGNAIDKVVQVISDTSNWFDAKSLPLLMYFKYNVLCPLSDSVAKI